MVLSLKFSIFSHVIVTIRIMKFNLIMLIDIEVGKSVVIAIDILK